MEALWIRRCVVDGKIVDKSDAAFHKTVHSSNTMTANLKSPVTVAWSLSENTSNL